MFSELDRSKYKEEEIHDAFKHTKVDDVTMFGAWRPISAEEAKTIPPEHIANYPDGVRAVPYKLYPLRPETQRTTSLPINPNGNSITHQP